MRRRFRVLLSPAFFPLSLISGIETANREQAITGARTPESVSWRKLLDGNPLGVSMARLGQWSGGKIVALLLVLGARPSASQAAGTAQDHSLNYKKAIRPLLAKYCFRCHGNARKPKADLNLERFTDETAVLSSRRTWKKVWDMMHAREMPPEDKPQPTVAEHETITDWVGQVLSKPSISGRKDPGPVVLRRLNRVEYNNTIYDLLGMRKEVRYKYFDPRKGMPERIRIVLHRLHRGLFVDLPPDATEYGYDTIGEALSIPPFLMEKYLLAASDAVERGDKSIRGMISRLRRAARGKSDRDVAKELLTSFGTRCFRRPIRAGEVEKFLALYDLAARDGEPLESAVKVPIQAMLVSPHFLFKVERDGPGDDPDAVRPLNDFELATRLSYFLWSTMPDAELFRLAGQGELRDPNVLERQARRMLRDPKARELSRSFGIQWLGLDGIEAIMPDPAVFPVFYKKYLPKAMKQEVVIFFDTIVAEDRSVLEFIDADWTWANGTLAQYYGLEKGRLRKNSSLFWKRYPLPDKRRGGVLGMAAVLAVTSNTTRTNPVKRGKWVLEKLLGAPPPPPLPDAGNVADEPTSQDGLTVRQRFEEHRKNPRCASCHKRLDPPGFGLENYDAIGQWREQDGGKPIDPSGTLADGSAFKGPVELKKILLTRKKGDFVRCLTEHLMTYALGRRIDYYDVVAVKDIGTAAAKDGYKFSRLIAEIVRSYPFRHRRNKGVKDAE